MSLIHSTAIVSPKAEIGENVNIGPFSIIHANSIIGNDSSIDGFCEIGYPTAKSDGSPLIIGSGSMIRSHSVFYEGSKFGDKLITGHRVTVREGTVAGQNLQIGTLSDIQGNCTIGDYVRFHSNVHIGQLSKVGNFVWIFPYVVLTNDPHPPSEYLVGATIEDYVAIATMSVILPGVNVGEGALIGAHALVNRNVAQHVVVSGSPAQVVCEASKIKMKDGSGRSAYPWTNHFHRGYPEDIVKKWLDQIQNSKGNEL